MKNYRIAAPDEALRPLLQQKIDNLTKPKGSLGMLERLALRVEMVQGSINQYIAARADRVELLVSGIPIPVK